MKTARDHLVIVFPHWWNIRRIVFIFLHYCTITFTPERTALTASVHGPNHVSANTAGVICDGGGVNLRRKRLVEKPNSAGQGILVSAIEVLTHFLWLEIHRDANPCGFRFYNKITLHPQFSNCKQNN
jgi:hypothetical protein